MMNIGTKYGFDILIISGSYGGHRPHTTYDGRRTTPQVWHKLPTGELKKCLSVFEIPLVIITEALFDSLYISYYKIMVKSINTGLQ